MSGQYFSNALTRVCALRQLILLVVAVVLSLQSLPARAYALSCVPVAQTVALGSKTVVAMRVADALPDGLDSYVFDVTFDPSVVAFDRAIDGFGLGLAFVDAVGGGVSVLGLEAVTLGNAAGNPVAFTAGDGGITVTAAIPEPGSAALVAVAVLALFGIGAAGRRG
jgi:hypothetical protein